jgi:hypothetical protein
MNDITILDPGFRARVNGVQVEFIMPEFGWFTANLDVCAEDDMLSHALKKEQPWRNQSLGTLFRQQLSLAESVNVGLPTSGGLPWLGTSSVIL